MSANRTLKHALFLAHHGAAILPIYGVTEQSGRLYCSCGNFDCSSPGKHPHSRLAPRGYKSATTESNTISKWFSSGAHNIGIATGAVSGLFVLDVDERHDGYETLKKLEAQHGTFPPTWQFLTGGGGVHIVFAHPGNRVTNSAGKLGPGLDIRGDGGYIVAPPSRHLSGRSYEISVDHHPDDVQLAIAPKWLLNHVTKSTSHRITNSVGSDENSVQEWVELFSKAVPEGRRNETIARLTGYLLRYRINPYVALELLKTWNLSRCNPPLPTEEVETIVKSIGQREIERRRQSYAR